MNQDFSDDNEPVHIPAPTCALFNKWRIGNGIYINDVSFVRDVLDNCKKFNAITYTANGAMTKKCRRLIASRVWGNIVGSTRLKRASNVHTKLYIIEDRDVWVSSMNLVTPGGYHNISVKVDFKQAESLMLYFERLWSLID